VTVLKVIRIFLHQPVDNDINLVILNIIVAEHDLQNNLILINRNSIIPRPWKKYSYLPSFAYHVQSSSLCCTVQTPTYFFRYYRWPLFLIPHSPFPIPDSRFLVLVTSTLRIEFGSDGSACTANTLLQI